jgi:hypothetical protein
MNRRTFLRRLGIAAGYASLLAQPLAAFATVPPTLLSAPIEITGAWNGSLTTDVAAVAARVRAACLQGLRLISDRQPARLRLEGRSSGPPAIWLHPDPSDTAWVLLDVGPNDWSKLAYQLGHELGHVLCNSWQVDAKPRPPCQWLEEAMVEAFSLRGLGRLALGWQLDPPFRNDEGFAVPLLQYRANLIAHYRDGGRPGGRELAAWFHERRATLETSGTRQEAGPALLAILAEIERDQAAVEDLGGLNRWPDRTALPLAEYLAHWRDSCAELGASGRLPAFVLELLKPT